MASPSIASYFNVRKRAATDDIVNARNKVSRLEDTNEKSSRAQTLLKHAILAKNRTVDADTFGTSPNTATVNNAKVVEIAPCKSKSTSEKRTRRTAKRTAITTTSEVAGKNAMLQPKIVKFTLGGSLSPRKKSDGSPAKAFQSSKRNANEVTPTKQPKAESKPLTPDSTKVVNKNLTNLRKELSFEDIKSKIGRSSRLSELKELLNKQQNLEEQYKACISKRNAKQRAAASPAKLDGQSLKEFDTIELEVLSRYVPHFICCISYNVFVVVGNGVFHTKAGNQLTNIK